MGIMNEEYIRAGRELSFQHPLPSPSEMVIDCYYVCVVLETHHPAPSGGGGDPAVVGVPKSQNCNMKH